MLLLIEDNPADVVLLKEALKESPIPIQLSTVCDGTEALAFLHHTGRYHAAPRPDLIVLDLNLPQLPGRAVLAQVKSDAKGTFRTQLVLPAAAKPGMYSLVLIADDGDISARADLTLDAAAAPAEQHAAPMPNMPGMDMGASSSARADAMPLVAQTTTAEWAAIFGFIALCLAGGFAGKRTAAGKVQTNQQKAWSDDRSAHTSAAQVRLVNIIRRSKRAH